MVSAAAMVDIDNKVLIAQRQKDKFMANYWEFPGGKLEDDELPNQCLVREIKEELRIEIEIEKKFKTIFFKYPDFEIKMHCFICKTDKFEGKLYEHIDYKLQKVSKLKELDWIEADIQLVEELMVKYDD